MHSLKHLHLPHLHQKSRHDVDMTTGSIVPHLLKFAFPLLLGNIFQQLYNMVDTWVVGNYVSNEAFSAVGSVGPIINTLIGFFTGLSTGAGAVISQFYGAKREDKVREAVHTSILLTLLLGVVFTCVGIFFTPYMLRLMKTPNDVFSQSQIYLTIYFAGILSLMVYNMGAGILRAVGDSGRPFYFLVLTAILNTVLDLVFVLIFGMGVEGVALATVIAQSVSAILVIITLIRSQNCVKLSLKHLKMRWEMTKKIFNVGFPAAFQMSITSFSNIFVQSYVNYFGSDFMAGWTAYNKIDQLAILPVQAISMASTTFVGQNLGCRRDARAKRGVFTACGLAVATTAVFLVPIMIFAPQLVSFFNSKPEVVEYGSILLRVISPFYLLLCINQVLAGALRGAGNSRAAMLILLPCFVVFRQVYLFVMATYICNEFIPIAMAYPFGWALASILLFLYYQKVGLTGKYKIVEE